MRTILAPALAATVLTLFGPPHIKVTEVKGAPPTPGAVLSLVTQHHTDEEDAQVTAEAVTVRNGQRSARTLTVTKGAQAGHYGVTKQWENGTPWVLTFTIKQGPDGSHGTASAVVKVNAAGAITGIEELTERNLRGDQYPRGVTAKDIDKALRELTGQP